jgi:hypothetical protein
MDFGVFEVFTMVATVGAIANPNFPHNRLKKHPLSKLCRCK